MATASPIPSRQPPSHGGCWLLWIVSMPTLQKVSTRIDPCMPTPYSWADWRLLITSLWLRNTADVIGPCYYQGNPKRELIACTWPANSLLRMQGRYHTSPAVAPRVAPLPRNAHHNRSSLVLALTKQQWRQISYQYMYPRKRLNDLIAHRHLDRTTSSRLPTPDKLGKQRARQGNTKNWLISIVEQPDPSREEIVRMSFSEKAISPHI